MLQVVSLEVRSNLLEGEGVIVPEGSRAAMRNGDKTSELPYVAMLNNTLPSDIRVISWATVDSSFSARFSCLQRTYKYFFPLGKMNLEVRSSAHNVMQTTLVIVTLQAMRGAAQRFLGEHDFRNFCRVSLLYYTYFV